MFLPRLAYMLATARHMATRERVTIQLPGGLAIEHSRIGINAIVAEYSRDITYINNAARGKCTPLMVDTCGGYPINCFLIQTPGRTLLRLDDPLSEHVLDASSQTTYRLSRMGGLSYVGVLPDERASVTWAMANDNPSTTTVTIGGKSAVPLATLTLGAPEVYLGRLEGTSGRLRFIPADESQEIPIRHSRDWH